MLITLRKGLSIGLAAGLIASFTATSVFARSDGERPSFVERNIASAPVKAEGTLVCHKASPEASDCAMRLQANNGKVYDLQDTAEAEKLFRSGKTHVTVRGKALDSGKAIEIYEVK